MPITGGVTLGEISLHQVDTDPSVSGFSSSIGSIALLYTGTVSGLWLKNAAGNTAWSALLDAKSDQTISGIKTFSVAPVFSLAPTFSTLTTGRIHFSGASGILAESASLFWDNTNFRLGIGTSTPSTALQVSNAANTSFMRVTPGWNGGTGTWIDLDITGPSGIGFGGPGSNPWLAYAQGGGQWFTDSVAGDIAYRNISGRLLFGITSGNADMKLSSTGLEVGPIGASLTNNPISGNGNINSFVQLNVQNLNAGTVASSDLIATANNGTDTTNFIDMGIQSSGSADSSFTIAGALGGYLYTASSALSIGTASANDLLFFTGGTLLANEKARISNSTGNLILSNGIRLGATAEAINGNIRFNTLDIEMYRNTWRNITFPKHVFDDFLWTAVGTSQQFAWISTVANGGTNTFNNITGNSFSGIVTQATGITNSATGVAALQSGNGTNSIVIGALPITLEWRVRVPVVLTTPFFEIRIGLQDTASLGDPTNGIYFSYIDSGAASAWQCVTRNALTSTTSTSGVNVIAGAWYRLRIEINSAGNSVAFYIDNGSGYTLVATNTTNITLNPLRLISKINKITSSTTSRAVDLDYIFLNVER
jgi:hypothetical protein